MTGRDRTMTGRWRVERADVGSEESRALLREYLVDVSDRWFLRHEGRRSTLQEIDQSLAEMPNDDLAPPTGGFVVAREVGSGVDDQAGGPAVGPPVGRLLGCAGVRLIADGSTVELKRMFVRPGARGTGVAPGLLAAAEQLGRELGATTIRLDTRLDRVEARALYLRHGYVEVPAFNAEPYAEVWYAKRLT